MAFFGRANEEHIRKVIKYAHAYDICGLLALSKAERQAMTIKSVLEALSCEEEPHRSEKRIRKEEKQEAIGKNGNITK